MTDRKGFSLIELLVVLAIAAILLMMAVPVYQGQNLKVRRVDGQTMLLDVQGKLERYLYDHHTYPKGLALLPNYANNKVNSHGGYYQISIDAASSSCPLDYCYVLRAKPDGVKQSKDEELELHSDGNKIGPW